MCFYCRRFPTPDIPYEEDSKCGEWVQKLFQEKVSYDIIDHDYRSYISSQRKTDTRILFTLSNVYKMLLNFYLKDRIYDHFVRNDNFDGLGVPEVPVVRNYSDFLTEVFWLIVVGVPSLVWFVNFILHSTMFAKIILTLIILAVYLILQLMINMSVIKSDVKTKKND